MGKESFWSIRFLFEIKIITEQQVRMTTWEKKIWTFRLSDSTAASALYSPDPDRELNRDPLEPADSARFETRIGSNYVERI